MSVWNEEFVSWIAARGYGNVTVKLGISAVGVEVYQHPKSKPAGCQTSNKDNTRCARLLIPRVMQGGDGNIKHLGGNNIFKIALSRVEFLEKARHLLFNQDVMMHEQGFPLLWSKQLGGTGQYS